MAMREFLLHNIMGAGKYGHHAYQAFRTLKATIDGVFAVAFGDDPK